MRNRTRPDGLLADFEIRATRRSTLRVRILVFRTLATMRQHLRHTASTPGRCHAMTRTWQRARMRPDGAFRLTPDMGEIVLCASRLGTETLTHECAHAALAWQRRRRLDSDDEEPFCYALGFMTRQLVRGLRDRDLIA